MNRTFEHLVTLYKDIVFDSDASEGHLLLNSQEKCDILNDILPESGDFGVSLEQGTIALGETVLLNVRPPRFNLGKFYRKFSDFLENPKNRIKEPKRFYISGLDYYNKDTIEPASIKKYKLVLKLINLLKESAAYLDEINCDLVFFDSSVLKIPVIYDAHNLDLLNVDIVNKLFSMFAEDMHREQKLTILGNSIKSLCENTPKSSSFNYLLNNISQLNEHFEKGYKVFVSGFSYEKVVDQLRTAKVEEMGKIHKTFSDIQNHILGIPVATVIVATQLKHTTTFDGQAIINSAIMIGCIVFCFLVLLVLCNQWQTLNAIKEELKYKKNQIDRDYNVLSGDVKGTFENLFSRLRLQKIALFSVGLIMITGGVLTSLAYLYFTDAAFSKMQYFIHILKLWLS
ncbi:hypothetical protein EDF78_101100 [Rahnella sp. BIGb0236]|uniref:hypothetical protein n=1 Tax=Rahnella sp. BIGb0236 TaxID=2485117 RepID=UPI00105E5598|nr:hypothetical protein [Rahnella sp. BIGb0236]TDS97725.1 hypothetical protein EDF78_101100 [Rahnella sp. BIGb0236]